MAGHFICLENTLGMNHGRILLLTGMLSPTNAKLSPLSGFSSDSASELL